MLEADLRVLRTLSASREPRLLVRMTTGHRVQTAMLSILALKPDVFVSPVRLG